MKKVIIIFACLSILLLIGLEQKRWDIRPYREIKYSHLNTIYIDEINKTVSLMDEYDGLRTELVKKGTLPELKDKRFWELQKELKKEKKELRLIKLEIIIKKYKINLLLTIIATISSLYLIISGGLMIYKKFPVILLKRRKKVRGKIIEEPPQEVYISLGDLRRRTETGFLTKKEAEDWLRYNPSFWCSYCGGKLKGDYVGKIQKVTFLRNPPEGAKDLKIILAELWYAYPVPKVKCTKCGRIVEF
jgi:hypothetical protein